MSETMNEGMFATCVRSTGWLVAGAALVLLAGCSDVGTRSPSSPSSNPGGATTAVDALVPARTVAADTVVVQGHGFGPASDSSRVLFTAASGTVAATVISGGWSDTRIAVLVPGTAVSGPVRVMIGQAASSTQSFQVAPAVRTYANDVLPLLQSRCSSCHGPALAQNNLNLTTLATVLHGGVDGPAIIPRQSARSLIILKTGTAPPFGVRMPQGGPYLSDGERLLLADWIDQGARAGTAPPPQPPTVALTAPVGGEQLLAADPYEIQYTATDPVLPSGNLTIALDFSSDGGASWASIASGEHNTGKYAWVVPALATTRGRVRVVVSNGQLQASDSSHADFAIAVPPPPSNPVLAALVPARTVARDTVEVQGSGFGASQGTSQVLFTAAGGGTVAAAPAGSWSDTGIPVLVPASAVSGPVVVKVGTTASGSQGFQLAPAVISFAQDISRGIFDSNGCAGCHNFSPYNSHFPGNPGLDVNSYQTLMAGNSQHGPVVRRRHSATSLLWQKLTPAPPVGSRMPQGGPYLDSASIQKVADWIDQGARNN